MADFCAISEDGAALRQGEILSNAVSTHVVYDKEKGTATVHEITHSYVIVASQDCDLDQDYRVRMETPQDAVDEIGEPKPKNLAGVFFVEVFTAEEINNVLQNPRIWEQVRKNTHARYQFFERVEPDVDLKGNGLPELTVDFKRYFTIEPRLVYAQIQEGTCFRRCRIKDSYSQHFFHRLYHYLSRVGLPEQLTSEPG